MEQHKEDNLTGIFHCFTADINYAQRAIDSNFKLGIGGVVTFKNNDLEKVLKSKNRNYCAPPAPAQGLYLSKIIY